MGRRLDAGIAAYRVLRRLGVLKFVTKGYVANPRTHNLLGVPKQYVVACVPAGW